MTRCAALALTLALSSAALAQEAAIGLRTGDRALVAQLYADLARGDVDAVADVLSDRVVWLEGPHSPQAGSHVGGAAVSAHVLRPHNGRPADVLHTLVVERDRVVATGASRRPDPATGRLITTRFRHVWWLTDGRVTRVERSDDGPDLSNALCGDSRC